MDTPLRRVAVLLPYLMVILGLFPARSVWLAMLGYHAGMALLLSTAKAWPRAGRFLVPIPFYWILLTLLGGISSGVGLYLLWPWLGLDSRLPTLLGARGLTASSWLPFICYFSLVNPWLEELYWRGWLGGPSRLPQPGDLWFGGYHVLVLVPFVPWPWWTPVGVALSGAGWLWRQIARRDGSLQGPALFHFAADASIIVAIYLHIRVGL